MGSNPSRRHYLAGIATLLSGCSTDTQTSTDTPQPTTETNTSTATPTETDTPTATPTETPSPAEKTYTLEELGQAVQSGEISQDSFTLNFMLADSDAEYNDSVLFDNDKYNGEITVEIDVTNAYREIRLQNGFVERDIVQDFVEIVNNKQARKKFIEEETPFEKDTFNYEVYTNESLTLEERIQKSNFDTLWFTYEMAKTGGIISDQNEYQAMAWQVALQQCEVECGFDTLVWGYQSDGHGLAGAAENMTRNPENTEEQNIYIIETVDAGYPIVEEWRESPYSQGEGISVHPIKKGYNGSSDNGPLKGMASNNELLDVDFDITDEQLINEFDRLYRTEDSAPFLDYSDRIIVPAHTSLETGLKIDIEKDTVTATV